jgi:hypothetical protein
MMAVEASKDEAGNFDRGAGSSWSEISPPASRSDWRGEMSSEDLSRGRQRGAKIEFLWFGDCSALVKENGQVEVIGDALQVRGEEKARAQRLAAEKNLGSASGVNRPEIEPLLRAHRNRINSGRNWLFSPDLRAAAHVARRRIKVHAGAELLLASDGFLALVSDYGAYDAASLMAAVRAKGLAALGEELRAIERADPQGERFPRFKKSDDATALYFRLA